MPSGGITPCQSFAREKACLNSRHYEITGKTEFKPADSGNALHCRYRDAPIRG